MALKAGYKGIKKYIADKLNSLGDLDSLATDAEVTEAISDSLDAVVGWNQEDTHDTVETLLNGKVDNSVVGPVEDGETASQAYTIGQHFIKDGKFCTVIAAIVAEATLTKDTNYVEGNLGDTFWVSYLKTGIAVAAGSYATVDIPAISGYSCINYSVGLSGTGVAANCDIIAIKDSDNHINSLRVQNRGNDSHTWALVIDAQYVKTNTIVIQTLT